jgi:DNA-binding LacI/PurR family transcriptional regulator
LTEGARSFKVSLVERSTTSDRPHVTIADVARSAGVSRSTVSNVLHGRTSVAPGLRTRVHRAIDELGYRPSAIARALALQRSRQLGAVIPDLGNPFFADLVRGAEEQATRDGYLLLIASVEVRRGRERETIEALLDRRPDGLLLGVSPDEAAFLERINVPVVVVDSRADGGAAAVAVDHELGARLAVRHLLELGHRRIAAAIETDASERNERIDGYRAALREAGITPDPALELRDERPPGAREPAPRPALATAVTRLGATAVVCGDDLVAVGLIDSLEARGVLVPRDVSVVGFDDIALAGVGRIGLTTVRQPAREIGALAARLLVRRLDGQDSGQAPTLLEPELVVRRTTAPPGPA